MQTTEDPLLKQLLRYVMSDEARHVAFGVLSLKEFYEGLSDKEMLDRQEFAFEAAVRMRDRFLQQEVWERMGVPVKEAITIFKQDDPELKNQDPFQQLLFSKIVPELQEARPARRQRRLAPQALRHPRRHPVRGLGRHRRGVRDARRGRQGPRSRRVRSNRTARKIPSVSEPRPVGADGDLSTSGVARLQRGVDGIDEDRVGGVRVDGDAEERLEQHPPPVGEIDDLVGPADPGRPRCGAFGAGVSGESHDPIELVIGATVPDP